MPANKVLPSTEATAREKRRVLVVDDEENIRLTLVQLLEDLGFEVDEAINGWEAVYKARNGEPYWLVLLDVRMPGMDGLEALYNIKKDAPSTRVALVTAHGTVNMAVDAMKYGSVDFIQKPFKLSDIRNLVSAIEGGQAYSGG